MTGQNLPRARSAWNFLPDFDRLPRLQSPAMSSASPLLWTLRSIARIERRGDLWRGARLTEPGHVKWHRMRRRLDWADFVELLHEDLASAFPRPFNLIQWDNPPLASLTPKLAEDLVLDAARPDDSDTLTFIHLALALIRDIRTGHVPALMTRQSQALCRGCASSCGSAGTRARWTRTSAACMSRSQSRSSLVHSGLTYTIPSSTVREATTKSELQ
jgi:hypothetical protein